MRRSAPHQLLHGFFQTFNGERVHGKYFFDGSFGFAPGSVSLCHFGIQPDTFFETFFEKLHPFKTGQSVIGTPVISGRREQFFRGHGGVTDNNNLRIVFEIMEQPFRFNPVSIITRRGIIQLSVNTVMKIVKSGFFKMIGSAHSLE